MNASDQAQSLDAAQAIEHGLTIVTPDAAIQRYPVRVLW